MADWTALDDIDEVSLLYLNETTERIKVNAIICNGNAQPLWLTYIDEEGQEVIVFPTSLLKMTILSRRAPAINGQSFT